MVLGTSEESWMEQNHGQERKEMRLLFFSSVVLGHLLGKIQSIEIAIGLLEQPDTPELLNSPIPSTIPLFLYQV